MFQEVLKVFGTSYEQVRSAPHPQVVMVHAPGPAKQAMSTKSPPKRMLNSAATPPRVQTAESPAKKPRRPQGFGTGRVFCGAAAPRYGRYL